MIEAPPSLADLLPKDCSARAIRNSLDQLVIGQVQAKTDFSVLLSMHLSWFLEQNRLHKAPNAILIGPTGVGKTHTLRTAAEYLNLPYAIVDATSLVPSGILGYQVEDVLSDLVKSADEILRRSERRRFQGDDIALAERGVIFVDEFDKIRKSEDARDPFGSEQVQRRLLTTVEGAVMSVGQVRHDPTARRRSIDTSGILFVMSGAFDGITSPKIRNARPDMLQRSLRSSDKVISVDVVTYGFLPELIARLQILIRFDRLEVSDLLTIMGTPDTSPAQVWMRHFERLGKELVITDDAMKAIALQADLIGMGARGLQQVLFPLLASIAFDFESSSTTKFVLDEEAVMKGRRRTGD